MPLPLRHGMTLGELALYMEREHPGLYSIDGPPFPYRPYQPLQSPSKDASAPKLYENHGVVVVPMQNWRREEFFDQTGVKW